LPKRKKRGRKPGPGKRPVPHRARPVFLRTTPVHVRLRVGEDVPRLRNFKLAKAIRKALCGGKYKDGFRICQFSIQRNHVHLVCEAHHHLALSRGMQGFNVRFARAVNGALDRRGTVLSERYDVTMLKTATQVRAALCYVLHNARRHGDRLRGADGYSSARYFDGWSAPTGLPPPGVSEQPGADDSPVMPPLTRMLRRDWRYGGGLVYPDEMPAAGRELRAGR
jgi:REP element-mobilizing transposase RayT